VYIAQPPLFSIKKGKSLVYIKDEREFVRAMVKRASEGITVRYGEGAAKLEGAALTRFITTLNEYLQFLDKVEKRVRDGKVAEVLPALDLSKRADFEGEKKQPPKKIADLEKALKKMQKERSFREIKLTFDDEHNLWEARFVNSEGAEYAINWELASAPEYRQMIAKYRQIAEFMQPPFVVEFKQRDSAATEKENAGAEELSDIEQADLEKAEKKAPTAAPRRKAVPLEPVEKQSARELFEYVLNEGRKDFTVQRYKGLGEMSAEQLWKTTMDPEKRTLLSVKAEDIEACEAIFTTLMGEDVEARRKFIEDNALDVKNLDI
jgi:DNA gyrase subunit B